MAIKTMRGMAAAVATGTLLLINTSAFALEKGDWLFRVRGIDVIPNDSSSAVSVTGLGAVKGTEVSVNSAATVEADVSYMVTDSVGLELIAATTRHTITGNSALIAALPTLNIPKSSDVIGVTDALPPTLLLQYHFLHAGRIRPYVGAGVNGTLFYDSKSGVNGIGLKVDNTVGYAFQGGVDVDLNKRWFVNLDLKYINIEPKAKLYDGSGTIATTNVKINPFVVGLGIGTTF